MRIQVCDRRRAYCRKRSKVLRPMPMRLELALCMLTVLTATTSAATITCNAGAVSVPVVNPSSVSRVVGLRINGADTGWCAGSFRMAASQIVGKRLT